MILLLAFVSVLSFVVAAFFAGCETAFITASRIKLQHRVDRGSRAAGLALNFLERPETFLSAVLIGTNLGVIACSTAFTGILSTRFGEMGASLATAILVPLFLVFEELIPKGLALSFAETASVLCAPPLKVFTYILYPLIKAASWLTLFFLRMMGLDKRRTMKSLTAEEIVFHLKEGQQAGLLSSETISLASRALDLKEFKAGDIKIPLERVVMAEAGMGLEAYRRIFTKEAFSRIPLYRGSRQNVVSVLSVKDLLEAAEKGAELAGEEPLMVGESTSLAELLLTMKNKACHMALVCDNDGNVVGMVTMEDILEKVMGTISDEYH